MKPAVCPATTRILVDGLVWAVVIGFALQPDLVAARCGVERWSVKTGSDQDVAKITNAGHPTTTTVSEMNGWNGGTAHSKGDLLAREDSRYYPEETTVWRVRGIL